MEKRDLICIGCPLGCALAVTMDFLDIKEITGNTCKRGEEYARKEVLNPTRILTTVVCVESRMERMLPVKTRQDIPKDKLFEVMDALRSIRMKTPVFIGDVILDNVAETGVPVVASKEILE